MSRVVCGGVLALTVITASSPSICGVDAARDGAQSAARAVAMPRRRALELLVHRGGAMYDPMDAVDEEAAAELARVDDVLARHKDELADFMGNFEQLLERARRTCKRSALGFKASASRISQRSDRVALHAAHRRLAELYRDAQTYARPPVPQVSLYVAATLRLHALLNLLLRDNAASVVDDEPLPSFLPSEELAVVADLRAQLCLKPTGTIAEVLAELRRALVPASATHRQLVYAALLAAPSAGTEADAGADVGASVALSEELRHEVALAIEHAQAAHAAHAAGQAALSEAEGAIAEHTRARAAVVAEAERLAARVAELEEALERASAEPRVDEAAARQATQVAAAAEEAAAAELAAAREAAHAAQAGVEEARQGEREAHARAARLEEELASASHEARRASTAAATLEEQVAALRSSMGALDEQHTTLQSAQPALQQRAALAAQLEEQEGRRAAELAKLDADAHAASAAGAPPAHVPLEQLRQVQLERAMQHERLSQLQAMHAAGLRDLEAARRDAAHAAAACRDLTSRLELADRQIAGFAQLQPPTHTHTHHAHAQARPDSAPAGAVQLGGEAPPGAATVLTSAAALGGGLSTLGGSLLATLGKQAKKVTEQASATPPHPAPHTPTTPSPLPSPLAWAGLTSPDLTSPLEIRALAAHSPAQLRPRQPPAFAGAGD